MGWKDSDESKVHSGMKRKYKRQVDAFDIYALSLEKGKFTVSRLKALILFKMNGSGHTRFFKTAKRNDIMVKWSKVQNKQYNIYIRSW